MKIRHLLDPRLLYLYAQAIRLTLHAQRMRTQPIPDVIRHLTRLKALPAHVDTDKARRAAIAAGRHLSRFGFLDTCVVRALVLGTLLCDYRAVALKIGFGLEDKQAALPQVSGHAWLLVDNQELLQDTANAVHQEARSFALSRS